MPDLVVEDGPVVELKCVECFAPKHLAQCLSYLHASGPWRCFSISSTQSRMAPGHPQRLATYVHSRLFASLK